MARSLLRQLEQIRRSATYDDAVASVYTSGVAEPTVSGSLEQDLNVMRTLVKELKGTSDWFGDLGNYFDPSNTDAGSAANKDLNLTNIKNNTLDAKTVILAVSDDNSGAGYTVSGTTAGALISATTAYATPTDRRGLPIFASTANTGSYFDEGGLDRVVRVDVINLDTGNEMKDASGNTIYAKFHDGADFGGTGTGTDVYAKFYANGVATDLSTLEGAVPAAVAFVYPYRKLMSEMSEYEWLRTDFVSSWEGDVELVEDIHNIWTFTGATDNDGSATPWDSITGNYLLNASPTSLKSAIDALNTGIGDATYTSATYLTDGEDITVSLDALSEAIISNDGDISGIVSDIGGINTSISTINGDISDLQGAVGATSSGTVDFANNYYVADGSNLVDAISTLDDAINTIQGALDATSGAKYVESVGTQIDSNTAHALPYSITYTPVSTAGQEGANMDVYVDGQLLAADTGAAGVNADRDYAETSTTSITFRFNIQPGRNITYVVKQ